MGDGFRGQDHFDAMAFAAASTGALPFLMQAAADEVFIAKNRAFLVWLPPAVVLVTTIPGSSPRISRGISLGFPSAASKTTMPAQFGASMTVSRNVL